MKERPAARRQVRTGAETMNFETHARSPVGTVWLLALAAALWAALATFLVLVVPSYEAGFRARLVRLPAPTVWVVAAGHWAENYWYVLPLFGLLVLPVVVLLSWLLRRPTANPSAARLWFGALIGAPALLLLAAWVALLLP
jgi:hypothetical protein